MKRAHYHNKEHTISVIKRARRRHMATHTTQQVCAVWAELENSVMSKKKKTLLFFLLELHDVTVNDGWDVRGKNDIKSLREVYSSCRCHCEISLWDCISENLCICGFTIWSEKVVWFLTEAIHVGAMPPAAKRRLWWEVLCNEICSFVWSTVICDNHPLFCYVESEMYFLVIFSFTVPTAKTHNDSLVLFNLALHSICCLHCTTYVPRGNILK